MARGGNRKGVKLSGLAKVADGHMKPKNFKYFG